MHLAFHPAATGRIPSSSRIRASSSRPTTTQATEHKIVILVDNFRDSIFYNFDLRHFRHDYFAGFYS